MVVAVPLKVVVGEGEVRPRARQRHQKRVWCFVRYWDLPLSFWVLQHCSYQSVLHVFRTSRLGTGRWLGCYLDARVQ